MRWGDFRRSDNIDDREASSGGPGFGGGFGGPGIRLTGGTIVVVVIASLIFGINPLEMLGMLSGGGPPMPQQQQIPPQQHAMPGSPPQQAPGTALGARTDEKEMVYRIVGDTEDTWSKIFSQQGARYQAPRVVLYRGATQSACGRANAAVGPFYCPTDREVYLDRSFFNELSRRFGAPGDFAQAYVIAHEIGHHVQNQLGVMERFDRQARQTDKRGRNAMSVRLELQADCFAGVWGHYAQQRNLLEAGDVDEGLRAAAAVGDDRLQQQAQGTVVPDAFTHGTSAQRQRWFRVGFDTGDIRRCDTFSVAQP